MLFVDSLWKSMLRSQNEDKNYQDILRKSYVASHTIKQFQGRMQYGSHGFDAISNYK